MRRFTTTEEQALLALLAPPAGQWAKIPPAPGKCPYNRLAARGCAQVMTQGPARHARLTPDGRYFAQLLREAGLAALDKPLRRLPDLPAPAAPH